MALIKDELATAMSRVRRKLIVIRKPPPTKRQQQSER
jgi:hypothetical protein